jgi:L-aspartate oxidase
MQKNAGIVRNDADLTFAQTQLKLWEQEMNLMQQSYKINKEFYELKNMITVALLIVEQSLQRNENKGGFIKLNPKG